MSMTVDLRGFNRSMLLMAQIPKKYGPDILNKSVVKVAIGSGGEKGIYGLTKKATKARIESDLKRNKLGLKLAVRWLKRQGKPATRENVARAYEQIRKARVLSARYIAISWVFAIMDIARKVPGMKLRMMAKAAQWDRGTAKDSFATPARPESLNAGIFSTARGAQLISNNSVIQMAVDGATADNAVYLRRKWGAAMDDAIAWTNTAGGIN